MLKFPRVFWGWWVIGALATGLALGAYFYSGWGSTPMEGVGAPPSGEGPSIAFHPRRPIDTSGFVTTFRYLPSWSGESLEEVATYWHRFGPRALGQLNDRIDLFRTAGRLTRDQMAQFLLEQAALYHYDGKPQKAAEVLDQLRELVQGDPALAAAMLYTVV